MSSIYLAKSSLPAKRQECATLGTGAACPTFGGPPLGDSERAVAKVPGEETVLDALQDVDDNIVIGVVIGVVIVVIEHGLVKGGKVGQVTALV